LALVGVGVVCHATVKRGLRLELLGGCAPIEVFQADVVGGGWGQCMVPSVPCGVSNGQCLNGGVKAHAACKHDTDVGAPCFVTGSMHQQVCAVVPGSRSGQHASEGADEIVAESCAIARACVYVCVYAPSGGEHCRLCCTS
jgi:hypothetical protein